MNTSNDIEKTTSFSKNTEDSIYFNFSYSALKLLGKNLYSNAANAISELVANSLDAHATKVYVYIDMTDKKNSTIEIIDDGAGMSYQDLAEKYVWVGRNKRKDIDLSQDEKNYVMGRKGIGKLAALYLSNNYFIITKKDNNENKWAVDLTSYDDSDYPKMNRVKSISIINEDIWNNFSHGTIIRLENVDLRRNGAKRIESLKRVFSDYYLLDSIKAKIFVSVITTDSECKNFEEVKKSIAYKNFFGLFNNSSYNIESKMSPGICFVWASQYSHIANCERKTIIIDKKRFKTSGEKQFHKEDGELINKHYSLQGWIAIHATIESKNAVDKNFIRNDIYQPNRLRLYVRNKLAVYNYFELSRSTQAMANYIEGEISFNILDDDDLPDIATSSRQDFLDDERIELLISIVDPIVKTLFNIINDIGQKIRKENDDYTEYLKNQEIKKRKEEEEARKHAEYKAEIANNAKILAENKQKEAENIAERERRRSQYILNISDVDSKNIMNSVHSIYNMSTRVKDNLDALNNLENLSKTSLKKLEKASTSNQRILSISKLISKAGRVIDDNDATKNIDIVAFIKEYVNNVASCIYESNDICIECLNNPTYSFVRKIKPLSFIMMIENIIGNSIKAQATRLTISFDDSSSNIFKIIFQDNGNGIDKTISDINSLFDFGVTTTNGSGLGLYYARKTMKEFKGLIELKANQDKGVSVILSWTK